MLQAYRKIFSLLDGDERRRFLWLMILQVLVAAAELVGLSGVLVLLNVLADPAEMLARAPLAWAQARLGIADVFAFQMLVAGAVIVLVLAGLAVQALGKYAMIRFAEMRSHTISARLMNAYLARPYVWFLQRNSAELARSVLNDPVEFVQEVFLASLTLLAGLILSAAIVIFLLVVDPVIALATGGLIGGGYVLTYVLLRRLLERMGAEALAANTRRFRLSQEAMGGIKEVKLLALERLYGDRFSEASEVRADRAARRYIIELLPRYGLQGLTFVVMIGVLLMLMLRSDGQLAAAIPTLGVFAFATMRLVPVMQQAYGAFVLMRGGAALLDRLAQNHAEAVPRLRAPSAVPSDADPAPGRVASPRLTLHRAIALDAVHFAYPGAGRPALRGISLEIPARSTVGFVGGTGAGKTTLVDMILGLLTPDAGALRIDGVAVGPDTLRQWQRMVGYVPQSIYLTDDTVAANIAFGVPADRIDRAALEHAARRAALHDFVTAELPDGYATFVGERGVRLSGGQRQRIGIARALYHDPEVLVFDEATSALDTVTERVVMGAVQTLRRDKTVILIAHRLGTVRHADLIHLMEQGRVVASGSYDTLLAGNETFRRMTGAE